MAKRTYKEIRSDILDALKDGKPQSYGSLERKVNTNWETIRSQIEDLEIFEAVSVDSENKVRITKQGLYVLKKMKK